MGKGMLLYSELATGELGLLPKDEFHKEFFLLKSQLQFPSDNKRSHKMLSLINCNQQRSTFIEISETYRLVVNANVI